MKDVLSRTRAYKAALVDGTLNSSGPGNVPHRVFAIATNVNVTIGLVASGTSISSSVHVESSVIRRYEYSSGGAGRMFDKSIKISNGSRGMEESLIEWFGGSSVWQAISLQLPRDQIVKGRVEAGQINTGLVGAVPLRPRHACS